MSLRQWLCDKVCEREVSMGRSQHKDHTLEILAEAEQTKAELSALTGRLDEYVADLRAKVRLELRRETNRAANHGRA